MVSTFASVGLDSRAFSCVTSEDDILGADEGDGEADDDDDDDDDCASFLVERDSSHLEEE